MSEILANIVVEQTEINFQPENNNINVTPEAINLNIFTGASPGAGQSSNGELLFNNINLIDGVPFTNYDGNKLTLGSPSNISITGGTNTYFLQTDGTGNLTWAAGAGNISGNGVPGGANTQIQFNDGGANFGGSAGFTFDKSSNVFTAPGNANITGNINSNNANLGNAATANYFIGNLYGTANIATVAGTVTTAAQPNITSVGNLTSLNVTGNITGNLLTGTLTTAAQPNITSLGNLTSLNVDGTTSIYEAIENVALISAQTGTYNFDLLDGSIQYSTANASANLIINFRGNVGTTANTILGNGKSITSTYIMTTGSNVYTISSIQIDSANANIAWVNGATPLAFANCATAYTFTIIKTSTTPTYKVFASATRYS